MFKKRYKLIIIAVMLIVIAISSNLLFVSCKPKSNDKRKRVEVEVLNSITKEKVEVNELTTFGCVEEVYDGSSKQFDVKLKLKKKYLDDSDFTTKDMKKHIKVLIRTDGVFVDIKDWPIEVGNYDICIKFNEDGWYPGKSIDDPKYFPTSFYFTLKIVEGGSV